MARDSRTRTQDIENIFLFYSLKIALPNPWAPQPAYMPGPSRTPSAFPPVSVLVDRVVTVNNTVNNRIYHAKRIILRDNSVIEDTDFFLFSTFLIVYTDNNEAVWYNVGIIDRLENVTIPGTAKGSRLSFI